MMTSIDKIPQTDSELEEILKKINFSPKNYDENGNIMFNGRNVNQLFQSLELICLFKNYNLKSLDNLKIFSKYNETNIDAFILYKNYTEFIPSDLEKKALFLFKYFYKLFIYKFYDLKENNVDGFVEFKRKINCYYIYFGLAIKGHNSLFLILNIDSCKFYQIELGVWKNTTAEYSIFDSNIIDKQKENFLCNQNALDDDTKIIKKSTSEISGISGLVGISGIKGIQIQSHIDKNSDNFEKNNNKNELLPTSFVKDLKESNTLELKLAQEKLSRIKNNINDKLIAETEQKIELEKNNKKSKINKFKLKIIKRFFID